jgi:hypothetical protein
VSPEDPVKIKRNVTAIRIAMRGMLAPYLLENWWGYLKFNQHQVKHSRNNRDF